MSGNLTNGAENRTLDWLNGNTTTAPTLPLKLRLMTANGDDATAGTEVTNSGGSAYAPQTVAPAAASGGADSTSSDIVFTNMPACTLTGWEIWDSAGTPFRWWHGTVSKTLNLGDDFKVPSGQFAKSLD